jgi:baculoviral IAP repeat-containing protein 6
MQVYCIADWFNTHFTPEVIEVIQDTQETSINQYETEMKPLQFGIYDIPGDHRFKIDMKQKPESKAIMRMISEISIFKTGLPLNHESTIWVRVSKECMNVFSFFISGPKNTPYENGIFEFHAVFPNNYPQSEPKVLLHTTGGGTVRFNPNLYHCGKVCLSLLNTWSGQDGEKWNPKTSTFLQVLVSIQSLIFVDFPYFNEPGWERMMHTMEGKLKAKAYNEPLQIATLQFAINNMIKNPPKGMEEVIKKHFSMKKEEILNTSQKWLDNISPATSKKPLETARDETILLLNKL